MSAVVLVGSVGNGEMPGWWAQSAEGLRLLGLAARYTRVLMMDAQYKAYGYAGVRSAF